MLDLTTLTASLPSAYFPLLCSWERVQAPPRLFEHSRTQLPPALRFCDLLQVRRSSWLCLFSISWGGLWSHQGVGARLPRQQSAKIAPGPSLPLPSGARKHGAYHLCPPGLSGLLRQAWSCQHQPRARVLTENHSPNLSVQKTHQWS